MSDAMLPRGDNHDAELVAPEVALAEGLAYGELDLGIADQNAELPRYGYRSGGFGFLVDPRHGSEVVQAGAIGPLPGAAPYVTGLLNLRGNVVPVFNLDQMFATGVDASRGTAPFALVLDKGERAVAIALSDFPVRLTGLRPLDTLPQLPRELAACVDRAYSGDVGVWLDFDHERFFLSLTDGPAASA